MKNTFEATYEMEMKYEAAYEAAKAEGNEAGIEKAREDYGTMMAELGTKGEAYCRIYREYTASRKKGNDLLDLNDAIEDGQVESLVACMRENGVERFTFSSTWSGAVGTAWLFQESGCRLEGLVQINSKRGGIHSEGVKKAPAYLFRIG